MVVAAEYSVEVVAGSVAVVAADNVVVVEVDSIEVAGVGKSVVAEVVVLALVGAVMELELRSLNKILIRFYQINKHFFNYKNANWI